MRARGRIEEVRRRLLAARTHYEVVSALAWVRGSRDLDTLSGLMFLLTEFPDQAWAVADAIEALVARMPRLSAKQRFGAHRDLPDDQAHAVLHRFGHLWAIAAVLSLHRNGFVREAAIRRLAEGGDPRGHPFILNRTTDWVPIVSSAACEAVEALELGTCPVYARALAQRRRGTVADAWRLRENASVLVTSLAVDAETALWMLQVYDAIEPGSRVCEEGLASPFGPVRARVASLLRPGSEAAAWAARLARDPYPPVRLEALAMAAEAGSAGRPIIESRLFDGNARVRAQARILLGRRDYASLYREALPAPVAIEGLGETGTRADAEFLIPFLKSDLTRARLAAVRAVASLDAQSALEEVRALLFDSSAKVVREAVRATASMNGSFTREEVEAALAQPGRSAGARRATLTAVAWMSRWEGATLLVKWGGDPELRDTALQRLKSSAASLSVRPGRARPEVLWEFGSHLDAAPWLPPRLADRLRALAAEVLRGHR